MNKEELKKLQAELNSISEKKFSKLSDAKLAANDVISQRNKEPKFIEKVSHGIKNYLSNITNEKSIERKNIQSKGGKVAYSLPNVKKKFIESGKKQGRKNADTGFLDSIRTKEACIKGGYAGLEKQCVELKCPHCNKIGVGRAMYRWHFDKCKHKK
jgi:hypothetical protein